MLNLRRIVSFMIISAAAVAPSNPFTKNEALTGAMFTRGGELAASAPATEPSWDHQNIGRLNEVWRQFGATGDGIIVAILDSGVDPNHPDLVGKMLPGGWTEFDASGNEVFASTPHDSLGHGTAVTSLVLGGNASGRGIGVAPSAKFIFAKVQNLVGVNASGSDPQLLAGMSWAIDHGADIVVMSWGRSEGALYSAFDAKLLEMINAGIIPVAAVGNKGHPKTAGWTVGVTPVCNPTAAGNAASPANSPYCIGVGAVSFRAGFTPMITDPENLQLWDRSPDPIGSNRGKATNGPNKPDLVAPGDSIFVAWLDNAYQLVSGTSFAAPRVAGMVALLLQASEDLRNLTGADRFENVRRALGTSATRCPSLLAWNYPLDCMTSCPNQYYGSGVLHDSLAMWNLKEVDGYPDFAARWRTLAGTIKDSAGREIGQAVISNTNEQRVESRNDGSYSVIVQTGTWVTQPAPDWEDKIDMLSLVREPFSAVVDTVLLAKALSANPIGGRAKDFVLDASGILAIEGYVRGMDGNGIDSVAVTGFSNWSGFDRCNRVLPRLCAVGVDGGFETRPSRRCIFAGLS